LVDLIVRSPL